MKNFIELFCMYIFATALGVYIGAKTIQLAVDFIGVLILEPLTALGYLAIGVVLVIGLFRFIDEIRG